ncbi:MAG: AraC family transcriptional regulator, partial [Propionibacteriaceae bacterium]|nr:AraC family transcriptional regulator [Propionibacteriaceae bacterium]
MEWIARLNSAIDRIEENLAQEIEYAELARIACCSVYHFQRMFAYLADVPLSGYIRRRRMSLAATDLRSGEKVIDVALKYGYDSPTAFNRAFQGVHGISPSAAKSADALLKSYPKINFHMAITGAEEMKYRIEEKGAFRIIGVSAPLHHEIEKNFEVVPAMWQQAAVSGTIPKLASLMDSQPFGLLGVSTCNNDEEWKYFIAVASTAADSDFEEYTVPSATWAVFTGSGTNEAIQELEKRIVTEWLPTS